jgi:hypothetical protein
MHPRGANTALKASTNARRAATEGGKGKYIAKFASLLQFSSNIPALCASITKFSHQLRAKRGLNAATYTGESP